MSCLSNELPIVKLCDRDSTGTSLFLGELRLALGFVIVIQANNWNCPGSADNRDSSLPAMTLVTGIPSRIALMLATTRLRPVVCPNVGLATVVRG